MERESLQKKVRGAKMAEVQKRLEDGTRAIFESEKYAEYIKTISKFPRYSTNNCILIASQRPDATYVCGIKTWNELNRRVNKNEAAIMIMAPVRRKVEVTENVYDENHRLVMDEKGNLVTETVTREIQTFRPAFVFDYGQTSGEELPTLVHNLNAKVEGFEELKEVLLELSPVRISFESIRTGANGYFSPLESRIVVKEGLGELQTVKTMLHEIAHATMGHGGEDDKWDKESKEVMAESVAYWVSSMLGLDTSEYSFGYISGWSKDKEVSELKENLEIIKTTAVQLLQGIDTIYQRKELEQAEVEKKDDVQEVAKSVHHRKR